jgi:hypothetical protein
MKADSDVRTRVHAETLVRMAARTAPAVPRRKLPQTSLSRADPPHGACDYRPQRGAYARCHVDDRVESTKRGQRRGEGCVNQIAQLVRQDSEPLDLRDGEAVAHAQFISLRAGLSRA